MQKVEIVPSILSADFAILEEEIKKVERAGCRKLHLDIMDGHFVPNITIGPAVVKAIRKRTNLYLQTHLMIDRPEEYVGDFAKAGSDCIITHQEACCDFVKAIKKIKRLGLDAGVALRPKTPVSSIKGILDDIDMILIMTVEPGFSGQPFIEGAEKKVSQVKRLLEKNGIDIPIGVDGGVNLKTVGKAVSAGASHLIAGSAVFHGNAIKNIKALYRKVRHGRKNT